MKKFLFALSLATPIMFATDSFATDCPNLTTLIGVSEAGTDYGYLSNDGADSNNTDTYGISHNGEFVVDYGNKGKIHGYARCSTRSATDPLVGNNGDYVLQSDGATETLPDSTGQYCYCQLDGYTPNGGSTVSLSAPWVFDAGDVDGADDCAGGCASYCAGDLRYDYSTGLAFRAAVFGSLTCPAPASSPLRISQSTNNVSATSVASGAYAKGAYNANVGNINTALGYVENSSVATINAAKVSSNNMNLNVNGFTPSGTVNVNSNGATINGSFNVPTTVAMLDSWGADTTTNGTLGGIQPANITNGRVSGIDATFTGSASGNLSGTGSFSNASVHVDGWVADNPE